MVGQVDGEATQGQLGLDRLSAARARDGNVSVLRHEDAAHYAEQRRFAHAVGADHHYQFASLDSQVDALQNRTDAVVLGDVHYLDHELIVANGFVLDRQAEQGGAAAG